MGGGKLFTQETLKKDASKGLEERTDLKSRQMSNFDGIA